jgi:uncharacterized protein (DUF362 family)
MDRGKKNTVAIVRFQEPLESVRKAVELSAGFDGLSQNDKVFIKPNIVFWSRTEPFPKWGVITTSRVVEDIVILLKEKGVDNITIGEGMVTFNPKDRELPALAFKSLGYDRLSKKYGVRFKNIHEGPFERVDLGEGIELSFSSTFVKSDFIVNIPVLKTHAQTVVSLGIKNMKGVLDTKSRRKCHSPDPERDLNFMVSRLYKVLPSSFNIIDGIFTNECGPGFDGHIKRSNILVASDDVISVDMAGAKILGYDPSQVPYIAGALKNCGRYADFSDIEIKGERIEDLITRHEYSFQYNDEGSLPIYLSRKGIKGLSLPKYDSTICTYCSFLSGPIISGIAKAWKGEPWEEIEILMGKKMKPTQGKKKTILIGKCIYQANKNNRDIEEMIPIKGCPPSLKEISDAFQKAGVEFDPAFLENLESHPAHFMKKYEGKAEFDESFFRIS